MKYGTFNDNHEMADGEDAGFIDPDTLNFGLEPDSPVFTLIPGFEDISFDQIGLYTNEYRAALPTRGNFKLFLPNDAALISSGGPVDFVWESCRFADEYQLGIATDPDFNNIISTVNKEEMCYSYVVVTVEGLSTEETYYWRVKALTNSRSMNLASKTHAGPAYFILNGPCTPHLHLTFNSPATHELACENLSPFAGYQIEQSTNLLSTWESFTNFTAPVDGQFVIGGISNNPPEMFYRLVE